MTEPTSIGISKARSGKTKTYGDTTVCGKVIRFVSPTHFYADDAGDMGQGLFCDVDLAAGDCWWVSHYADPRWVAEVIDWERHRHRTDSLRARDERLCFFDATCRALVVCTHVMNIDTYGQGEQS